jgi:hypothetical protein
MEMGVFFHKGPILGTMEECPFPREIEKRVRFFYPNFYWGIRETCKRRLWKRATPCIWAPLGNLEWGFVYCGLGDTVIFGLLFLDPEDARSPSLGGILELQ